MSKKIVTYELMHEKLHDVLTGVSDKTIKISEANVITNACGKTIAMGMGRLKYSLDRDVALEIPELGINEFELSKALSSPKKSLKQGSASYLDKCRD